MKPVTPSLNYMPAPTISGTSGIAVALHNLTELYTTPDTTLFASVTGNKNENLSLESLIDRNKCPLTYCLNADPIVLVPACKGERSLIALHLVEGLS